MDEVIETTNEAAEDVNVFIQYLQDHIPESDQFCYRDRACTDIFLSWKNRDQMDSKADPQNAGKI